MTKYPTSQHLMPWAGYLCALAVLEITFGRFFSPAHTVGHDYATAMPGLLDGYYWFLNNGISTPPWFTPAFCAGVPLFADPQSLFYSPIQFFAFFADPLRASHLALLAYSSLGYLGMYLLCRQRLGLSTAASIFAALLWMLNGFVTHRMIIGHIGFLGISLIPLLTYLLLSTSTSKPTKALCITGAGILLASWVHSGLGTLLIAAALSVWGLICIAVIRGAPARAAYLNSVAAATLGLGLSASKLAATISTMSNLERTMYPLPGFASVGDLLLASFSTMMLPSSLAQPMAWPLVHNAKIYLDIHEWTLNITPIPFALILLAVLVSLIRKQSQPLARPAPSALSHTLLLLLILFISLAVQFYSPGWNAFLKTAPILKSISTPTRWMVLWLPIVCVGAAISLNYLCALTRRKAAWQAGSSLLLCVAVSLLVYTEPRPYYENQGYDPNPVIGAFEQASRPGFKPHLDRLGAYIDSAGNVISPLYRNNLFIEGVSQAFCANPIFGYFLEAYDPKDLAPGSLLKTLPSGHLNVKNPACYTFPTENHCRPGDHFLPQNIEAAQRFTNYQQWAFVRPVKQSVCDGLTLASVILSLGILLICGPLTVLNSVRFCCPPQPPK